MYQNVALHWVTFPFGSVHFIEGSLCKRGILSSGSRHKTGFSSEPHRGNCLIQPLAISPSNVLIDPGGIHLLHPFLTHCMSMSFGELLSSRPTMSNRSSGTLPGNTAEKYCGGALPEHRPWTILGFDVWFRSCASRLSGLAVSLYIPTTPFSWSLHYLPYSPYLLVCVLTPLTHIRNSVGSIEDEPIPKCAAQQPLKVRNH